MEREFITEIDGRVYQLPGIAPVLTLYSDSLRARRSTHTATTFLSAAILFVSFAVHRQLFTYAQIEIQHSGFFTPNCEPLQSRHGGARPSGHGKPTNQRAGFL